MDNQNQINPSQPSTTPPQSSIQGIGQTVTGMNPRQQVATRIRQANNVLITVNTNPTLDELAACIGLTLVLNKMGKHAVAVYSGNTPAILEFLQPENTIEKNTDSLRDFIISLDKSKADKLRYKVEDKVVKIFITPYRTSISEKDMEFSQGDVNVDVVVALGVGQQQDVDQAITAHGRILHDATVISINNSPQHGSIGTLIWQDSTSSSLSEMVTSLSADLGGKELLDSQIATSLLTGIVAVTSRFSNNKTSPQSLSTSATLLAAGANQQLVAAKLEPPQPIPVTPPTLPPSKPVMKPMPKPPTLTPSSATTIAPPKAREKEEDDKGTLNIDHMMKKTGEADDGLTEEERLEQIRIDNQGNLHHKLDSDVEIAEPGSAASQPPAAPEAPAETQPPAASTDNTDAGQPLPQIHKDNGGMLGQPPASSVPPPVVERREALADMDPEPGVNPDDEDVSSSPMPTTPLLSHDAPAASADYNKETLHQIEEDVNSPHLGDPLNPQPPDLSSASQAASSAATPSLGPIEAMGARDFGSPLHGDSTGSSLPPTLLPPNDGPPTPPTSNFSDPTSPPPVPPPMIPPVMPTNDNQNIL